MSSSALSPAASSPRTPSTSAPPRSLAPDIARGLMLALIALANVSWYLWGHDGSVGMTPHVPAVSAADSVVQFVMTVAVDHRAMPLFAFLFGYGMVQFSRSRLDRGLEPRTVRTMMRRRHWAMLLLGFLHAALLFYGDVLGAYGIAGLLLVWIFFGRRTRTLAIWVGVIAGILALYALFSVVSALALVFAAPPEVIAEMEAGAGSFDMGFVRDLAYGQSYLYSVPNRVVIWIFITVMMGLSATPLPILLGWIAARHRLLDEPWRHTRLLRRIAVGGIAIGWLGGLPDALMNAGVISLPEVVNWAFTGINSLAGAACGIGYAAAFGLLAARLERRSSSTASPSRPADPSHPAGASLPADPSRPADHSHLPGTSRLSGTVAGALSAVGQRSLTFYLFQSLLLAPLMASWGLGLGEHLSTVSALAIAFAVWLVSLPIAALMASRNLRGPAEMLLRRMTYGRLDHRPEQIRD